MVSGQGSCGFYIRIPRKRYAEIARYSEYQMEKCFDLFYGLHHDVGFMFQPAAVADYRLTGSPRARKTALHAANLLAGRFNPAGRFIRAWNEVGDKDTRGWAVYGFAISYLHTGKKEYLDAAKRTAHYCMANIPENGILPLDFRQPPEPEYEDSCGAYHDSSHHMTMTYADYFFIEAIEKIRGKGILLW